MVGRDARGDARRWRAAVVVLAALAAAWFGDARAAAACSCVPTTLDTAVQEADAVFVGEVLAVEDGASASGPTTVARIAVQEVHAGEVADVVEVRTPIDSAACGYAFEVGRADLVYAVVEGDGGLSTNLCDRTAPLDAAGEDLALLGEGDPPLAASPGDGGGGDGAGRWALPVGVVVLGAGALAAAVAIRRRRTVR
jgi:hypothetical protein